MKKEGHRSLRIGKIYVASSQLLDDVKAGKEPEKKHKTLDSFLKNS